MPGVGAAWLLSLLPLWGDGNARLAAQGAQEGASLLRMSTDIVPEIVLAGGAIVVLLYAIFAPRRWQGAAALLAFVIVAVAAVFSAGMLRGSASLTFSDTYARDGAAIWAKLIVLAVTAAVVGLSAPWFRTDARQGEYYAMLLFSALGAVLLAGATDLKQFVISTLLSSTTGFVLAAYHRRSSMAAEASIKYYLLGALTNAGMLIGVAYLFGLAGSSTLSGLKQGLPEDNLGVAAGAALVILALAFKMGAVPVHAWMPDIAQGAPAPVAAFITSAPKVGAFIFLARLVLALPDGLDWRPLIAVLAALTMTLGNLSALWQDDVRRLLGWSAVSQTGYGLLAVLALGRAQLAVPALLFFLLAYVLGNVAAFGVVVELRGRTALAAYGGLARGRGWLAGALTVSFLSFIGVPPLAGFVAKLALFAVAIDAGYTWLAVVAVINTVVSIFYYVRVIAPAYFGEGERPAAVVGHWAGLATMAMALAVVAVGLAAQVFLAAFADARLFPM